MPICESGSVCDYIAYVSSEMPCIISNRCFCGKTIRKASKGSNVRELTLPCTEKQVSDNLEFLAEYIIF